MRIDTDVLIVGAGHAGAQAAIALRAAQYTGRISLLGDESELPYERPPLSKEYLSGEKSLDRILIRPQSFWVDRQIDLVGGCRITAVDPGEHFALSSDGTTYHYQHLIWATGARARKLSVPGADAKGIFTVRTRADADHLADALAGAQHVVVVGGGYIGLEAAAVLRKQGKQVTLLESGSRVLGRVAGKALSQFYEEEHRRQGVDLRFDVQLVELVVNQLAQVSAVRLRTGELLPADVVVVGIGVLPNAEPLLAAGAAGGNGVWVDEYCRTTLPDVFAIGDVALHANPWCGGALIRVESVQNAADMAATVVRALMGKLEPYRATPWFWSHQFDLKLQTVGLSIGHDEAVVRGDRASRSFSVIYLKQGKVIALDCVNAMKDYVQGKVLVQNGARISTLSLGDTSVSLKDMGQ